MRVTVNGEERAVAGGTTIHGLLRDLSLDRATVVVEHNGQVVTRELLDRVPLEEGDRLEVVRFVGGG